MSTWDNYLASRKLPPGHYGLKKASIELEREYRVCKAQEKEMLKESHKRISLDKACRIVYNICKYLNIQMPKLVRISQDCKCLAGGCYDPTTKVIHLSSGSLVTLLHELSHHIVSVEWLSGEHDRDFLWVEEMVINTYKEIY